MRVPALIIASQLADLAAFLLAVEVGGLRGEMNGIAVAVVLAAGYPALLAMKVTAAVSAALIARRLQPRWGLIAASVGLLGAVTGIVAAL